MSKAVLYRGRKVDLEIHRITYPNGHVGERERLVHRGAVAIVPLLDDNTLCLIRNHRFAIGRELLEIPAGTLEHNERPEVCAARELEEETGYRARTIEPVCRFFTSPGIMNEVMHVFLARDLTPVGQRLEPSEQIQVERAPWSEALDMVARGEICDAKTIAALLYCQRFMPIGEKR